MSWFLVLCLIVVQCSLGLGLDLLDPPQIFRGTVWEDWNADGIRQSYEPGFAHAKVRLLYVPSGDTNFLLDTSKTTPIDPVYFFTLSDGQYYFDCLTPGNYSIEVEFPENRPSTFSPANAGADDTTDSDITIINGRVGSTGFFQATSGNAMTVDVGAVQYIFMNLFPMTGREAVPTEPDTVLGTTYSVFDSRTNTLYYRIERGPWNQYNFEDHAAFHQGFPGTNGPILRSMADRSSVKTNSWILPATTVSLFSAGKVYVLLAANGSFSDNGRLRGNYNPFRNSQSVKTSLVLSGENVVPTPVTTSASGTLNISFSFAADYLTYDLQLSDFGRAENVVVQIRGPADANSNGNAVGEPLKEGHHTLNVSTIPNFASNFFTGRLYALVTSSDHPSGHLRAQISGLSQSLFYTSSFTSIYGTADNYVKIALALDTNKHTYSYYITIEAPQDSDIELYFWLPDDFRFVPVTYFKSGLWVAQGFFWNLSPEQEQKILSSDYYGTGMGDLSITIYLTGPGFFGLDYIFPSNWY